MTPNYSLNYARSGSANSTASTSPLDGRSHRSAPAPFSPNEALIFIGFRALFLKRFLPVLNDRNRRHSPSSAAYKSSNRPSAATYRAGARAAAGDIRTAHQSYGEQLNGRADGPRAVVRPSRQVRSNRPYLYVGGSLSGQRSFHGYGDRS